MRGRHIYLTLPLLALLMGNLLFAADPRLILWNKLGSPAEVTSSAVGPSLKAGSGMIFQPGKFDGQGLYVPQAAAVKSVHSPVSSRNIVPLDHFAIEFWYKRTMDNDHSGYFFLDSGYENNNNGRIYFGGHSGYVGLWNLETIIGNNSGQTVVHYRHTLANHQDWLNFLPIGEWHHIALVHDASWPQGQRVKIFKDGVALNLTAQTDAGAMTHVGQYGTNGFNIGSFAGWNGWGPGGVIDNIKVWNYAKTDFSDRFDEAAGTTGAPAYGFDKSGDIVTYKHQNTNYQEIASVKLSESLVNMGTLTSANFSNVTMLKTAEGKPKLDIPSENGSIAAAVNNSNGTKWVTANFAVSKLQPIFLNGEQITDDQGKVFPQYLSPIKYVDNVTFNTGVMTFRIYHFSEWLIPDMTGKTFAGNAEGEAIIASGNSIIVEAGAFSTSGNSGQNSSINVAKISGLAYATVLCDVPPAGNDLYKPMTPSDNNYSVHFGYINRGNRTDIFTITTNMVSENAEHFGHTIIAASKTIAPWQVVSFSITVTNSAALVYERATLNATVSIQDEMAVSYNAFAGAYTDKTFEGVSGNLVYGGVEDLSYIFGFETEGYSLKVQNRVATINSPVGNNDLIPGAKVKYDLVIKNESSAVATDVLVNDIIPANCHLYYTDVPTVDGAVTWNWQGATDNNADSNTLDAVKYEITISANATVTASYTVTVD